MVSLVDPSVPIFGSPTTQSVRDNFAVIKSEIEGLQSAVGLTVPVTVANGGTGANNPVSALTNLGALPLAGGTMTGPLLLNANPTDLLGAATKQYVDAYFPVSVARGGTGANNPTAALAALGAAPIANPVFTGLPQAPTPPTGDSSTVIATTEYVRNVVGTLTTGVSRVNPGTGLTGGGVGNVTVGLLIPVPVIYGGTGATTSAAARNNLGAAPIVDAGLLGVPTSTIPPVGDNTNKIATTSWVTDAFNHFAQTNFNSIDLQGTPTAPTPAPGDSSNRIATTEFVDLELNSYTPLAGGTMTGLLTLSGAPVNALHAATKAYVDSHSADAYNFQGTYRVAANSPVLPATPANGASWTAVTADPDVGEALTVALTPLTVGTIIYNGDMLRYATGTGWSHIVASFGGMSVTQADARYLMKTGGTMLGTLTLAGDPVANLQAATKKYVDDAVYNVVPPGVITSVEVGAGLTGGGTSGDVTVSLGVPVSVAYGGTGSTSASGARTSLGAAPLDSPTFTGTVSAPTPSTGSDGDIVATTHWVALQGFVRGNQTISLTGDVTGSGTTGIPTVVGRIQGSSVSPIVPTSGQYLQYTGSAWTPVTLSFAPINSPNFTGIPTAPQAAAFDTSTQIANTAFVNDALLRYLPLTGGTLTGRLILAAPAPVSANEAVAKNYVDGLMSGSPFLSLAAGGTVNAPMTIQTANMTPLAFVNVSGNQQYIRFTKSATWDWSVGVKDSIFTISKDSGLTSQVRVNVNGDVQIGGNYLTFVGADASGAGATGGPFIYASISSMVFKVGTGNTSFVYQNFAGTVVSTLEADGDLTIAGQAYKPGGGAWIATSARQLKEDIKPYTTGLEALMLLNPVEFRYNGMAGLPTDRTYIGLIHDEVMHLPEMHRINRRKLREEDDDVTEIPALDSTALTYVLINAVKELAERVNALDDKGPKPPESNPPTPPPERAIAGPAPRRGRGR